MNFVNSFTKHFYTASLQLTHNVYNADTQMQKMSDWY